jgi:dihydroflavonol-4-reductase
MKIIITGADGMLGSNLVRMLLSLNHEVSVLLHPASCSRSLENLDIRRYTGDILKNETIQESFKRQDAVIHAAASTSIWPSRSESVRRINIDGTRNIINAAIENGLQRMIYIGSGSSVNTPGSKDSKYAFPGAKYGLDYIDSKYEALQLVLNAVKNKGLPASAILPTYMIGPYDSLPGSGKMILAIAQGKLKFFTGGGRNFVHVNDVCVAIVNCLESNVIGNYYIAGNENITYKDFFEKVARIVSKPAPVLKIPSWLVKSVGRLGSFAGSVTGRPPLLSYPMAVISCDKQYVSSDAAVRELGMPQTDIDVAIRDCYTWFVENGYLSKK